MPVLTAQHVAAVCAGRVVGDGVAAASRVVADSRDVRPGDAFVAVRGGHDFVAEAVASGAVLAVVERADALPRGATAVVVDDSVRALGELAASVRSTLDVRVVGITGSFGKTLTKDFVAAALGPRYRVHAAQGSYNTEVGLPLVVLGCPPDAEVLVVELGARRPGEIAELCAIALPHVGVLTGVGTTHLEIFGSRDAIARTKTELLEALPPDGLGVVPSDDDYLDLFAEHTAARLATVGPGGRTRYAADHIDSSGRTFGRVSIDGVQTGVVLPIPGRALFRNAAMAVCVATELGVDAVDAAGAIGRASTSGARMELADIGGWTVVNDAYNANPTSTAAALRTLLELRPRGQRWAVLGAMAELGPISECAHERIGRLAASLGYAGVVVVGAEARPMAMGAGSVAHAVDTLEEAAELVCSRVPAGAVVLVKGSLVTGLSRFPAVLRTRLDRTREEV